MKNILVVLLLTTLTLPVFAQKKETLFNGKNLKGWTIYTKDSNVNQSELFYIKDGVIESPGLPLGYIRTNKQFSNYQLHVEWRWVEKPGNSGILIHVNGPDLLWPAHYQGQLKAGDAGDFVLHGIGEKITVRDTVFVSSATVKPLIRKENPSSEKEPGQWNSMDVTAKDKTVVIKVNGVLQNSGKDCSLSKGAIGLQAEGAKIQFRNIRITPVKK